MAKANSNVANLHDRDPKRIPAQKPIPSDFELDNVKLAACELNQTFTALERPLKEHELEGSAIAMPSHLPRTSRVASFRSSTVPDRLTRWTVSAGSLAKANRFDARMSPRDRLTPQRRA